MQEATPTITMDTLQFTRMLSTPTTQGSTTTARSKICNYRISLSRFLGVELSIYKTVCLSTSVRLIAPLIYRVVLIIMHL